MRHACKLTLLGHFCSAMQGVVGYCIINNSLHQSWNKPNRFCVSDTILAFTTSYGGETKKVNHKSVICFAVHFQKRVCLLVCCIDLIHIGLRARHRILQDPEVIDTTS